MVGMQRNGAFLINGFHLYPGHRHFKERLQEELGRRGVKMDTISSTDFLFAIESDGTMSVPSLPYDFIVVLDKDKYILSALEKQGIRLFNSAKATEICDDKMLTYQFLANHDIPLPETIAMPLNYSGASPETFLTKAGQRLGYPLVVKTNYGSMGTGVYLVPDLPAMLKLDKELNGRAYLLQHFIASSAGRDIRVICIGGKAKAAYRRVSDSGDFRSNIALGGHGETIELTQRQKDIAEKAATLIGLDYCGIDLLYGEDGEPLLCEVNSNAFFSEIEKVTGYDIAGDYADYIIDVLNR